MARTQVAAQVKTVEVARGLFVIRYVSADDEFEPPIVSFALEPSQNQSAEFLLHPDAKDSVLWQPGSSLIMRAIRPVKIRVEVAPRRQAGSIAANVKVERLTQGEPVDVPSGSDASAPAFDFTGLRLLGHVAGLGDVFVGPNEWIAGPTAPSRIEGIAIEWPNKPPQLDIRYSVKLGQPQATPSRMMDIGSYAGTRGRAMPMTGVVFELSGAVSSDYQLCVEAAFLGSPTMRVIGKRVVLSGPTGREPLVGLRVNLEKANADRDISRATRPSPPPPSTARQTGEPPAAAKPASRVRVFRGRSKEDQSTR
jgi:hypothetical protein